MRYNNVTIRKKVPRVVRPVLATAINASMQGMDSQALPVLDVAWRVHCFAGRVLFGVGRTGRRHGTLSDLLHSRAQRFLAGNWQSLWDEVRERTPGAVGVVRMSDEATAQSATDLVREGLYSKAAALLERSAPAPASQATHDALCALNPDGSATGPMPAPVSTESR